MHNNAPVHRVIQTRNVLANVNVNVNVMTPWPAFSTDLNPIEYLSDIIDQHVHTFSKLPQTLYDLKQELIRAWNAISDLSAHKLRSK